MPPKNTPNLNQPIKKSSWPAFSPVISIVLIVVVALIVGAGLYYMNAKTKSANTNSTVSLETDKNTNIRANQNFNTNSNNNANSNVNVNGNVNLNNNSNLNANANANTNSNANSNTNSTGWQTYTNSDLGISFQYPDAWGPVTVETEDFRSYGETGQATLIGFSGSGSTSFKSKVQLRYTTTDFAPGREVWFSDVIGGIYKDIGLQNICDPLNRSKVYIGDMSHCTVSQVNGKWQASFFGQINSLDGIEVVNFVKVFAFETGDTNYPVAALSLFLTNVNEPTVQVSDSARIQSVYTSLFNKTADTDTNTFLTDYNQMVDSLVITK